jgi:DNA-damage-inducible protein J
MTATVQIRVDERVKEQATAVLSAMGMSMSDAVRIFLSRVIAEKEFPQALKVPNAATREAMAEGREIIRQHRARHMTAAELFDDLDKNSRQ